MASGMRMEIDRKSIRTQVVSLGKQIQSLFKNPFAIYGEFIRLYIIHEELIITQMESTWQESIWESTRAIHRI